MEGFNFERHSRKGEKDAMEEAEGERSSLSESVEKSHRSLVHP